MTMLSLSPTIQELLLRDQFACVPGLGGFLLKTAEPTLNHFTKEIKPAHSQLVFNHQLIDNDGQLAHLISVTQGITYKDAMQLLSNIVTDLKLSLEQKKYASFFPFGNFFLNEAGNIFFVARTQYNLHLPNYGLQPLKWEQEIKRKQVNQPATDSSNKGVFTFPSKEEKIMEATVVEVSEETIRTNERVNQQSIWWNIAASFVLISVSVLTLGVATLTWIGVYQEHQLASMTPDFYDNSSGKTALSPNTQTKEFVFVNGKLIALDERNSSSLTPKEDNALLETDSPEAKSGVSNSNDSKEINHLNSVEYFEFVLSQKGDFFLTGGSYITENAAKIECNQWINIGTPACIFKPKNSSFYRIVLGRFQSKQEIEEYSVTINTIPNANLSIMRWNLR